MSEPPLTPLETLPDELLTIIRGYLGPDFRNHVSFASTSSRIYSLYSDDDWKGALRKCHFGKGQVTEDWPGNHSLCGATWGTVAFALRQCLEIDGVLYIEEIRDRIFSIGQDLRSEEGGIDSQIFSPQIVEEQKLECTSFATSFATDWLGRRPFTLAAFWPLSDKSTDTEDSLNHRTHTAAAFQFATWPPLNELTIEVLSQAEIRIANPDGVTIWDCMVGIYHKFVGKPLAITDLIDVYANWTFVPRLKCLNRLDEYVEVDDVIEFLRETVISHPSSVDEVNRVISLVPESLHSNPILQAFSIPGESDKLVDQFPTVRDLTSWIRQYLPSLVENQRFPEFEALTTWGDMLQDVKVFGINQISPGSARFELEIEGGGFDAQP